jgi:hypothetical protein
MSDKRKRELMENLDRCYKVVQQNSEGISAIEIAKKLGVHRTTVHGYLNILELMGKVRSEHGEWHPKESKNQGKIAIPEHLIERFWREEEEIEKENLHGDPYRAYQKAKLLWFKLSSPFKEKLQPTFNEVEEGLKKAKSIDLYLTQIRQAAYLKHKGIPLIVYDISRILHEMEGVKL